MTHSISRRTLARGAAWAAPAVAAAAAVPAEAASQAPASGCYVTDAQLNAGYCGTEVSRSWQITGARTFGNQFGGAANAQTSINLGLKSTCNYQGSVTFKMKNGSGESYITAPTLTLKNGKTYTGLATLGNVASGGAKVGFDLGGTIQWQNSLGTTDSANRAQWDGAVVAIPMEYDYTSPDGTTHSCLLTLSFSMSGSWSASGAQTMVNPQWSAVSAWTPK